MADELPLAPQIRVRRLRHGQDLALPARATPGSAGFDLRAAVTDPLRLEAGARAVVPTGLTVQIPAGWEGQVRPRSGLARRYGVTVLNSPGTIDSDYRGEIEVLLINLGSQPFVVERGERIAQLVFAPVVVAIWQEVDDLESSDRGSGGFGSTGRH
jgi:dUTP diphosphatase